ncbi:nicotinate phosphoribosyltransferase [Candidatus Kinetoplastibacterium blastocrithidii TCC012E]|uniref:nicotinate phosphoribosyltransferase n=2 Tax=cellular organisms TaxID=131567 RepID=S9V289_9TRYP|nr:nicotinate phosphoribosyltransferase [Candidatus Kinetoplastibacterium blastocrithidii]EPY20308.1 nicotinate phosphoribosyltransferase [Strigomonas culicis]AFZ83778.1 nicotinate phosphoribosyltransferase [Candidatus Kinetoplastibacterium blastocrithidii (ex Strigomonas culicis)]AGF49903.1 nicotinate phosphoribosyltransferase [Candidatus Kinetoplastibacterium blastocrithidii TCC012E]EPY21026.1 nicotinate phosphoribosyltransferase [Strigomonas culicis]EPY22814.1 nicotinate phosphoribosyltrans|eukprot:EPY20308.1 nicotinate phosphoribosyltransferase [Strigomonas culicis]
MIITSLLDTDLYKFTMMQVVLHHFPSAQVVYRFKCRSTGVDLASHIEEIQEEISHLCALRFTEEELSYLEELRFIKSDFIDFLRLFYLPERCVSISNGSNHGEICITVSGPWLHTILFEIFILAIVNEVYFRKKNISLEEGRKRLRSKINLVSKDPDLVDFRIAEYGTRRRFSQLWQDEVVSTMKQFMGKNFAGTSNVMLAKRYDVSPLGTMGHEYLQACQALGPRLRDSQVFAFDIWAKEYRGDLGIVLSDVYGMEAFLRDFDIYFCKLFDGVRHDSGDPFIWGDRLLDHYSKNRVDYRDKTLVFSDSLTFPLAIKLLRHFSGRCRVAFGIGTNLTNDMGKAPLQIVMKMVRCNDQPVAKVSDSPEKIICEDPEYLSYIRKVFDLPLI